MRSLLTILMLVVLACPFVSAGVAAPKPMASCCDADVCCCGDENTCLCESPAPADEPGPAPGTPAPRPAEVAKYVGGGAARMMVMSVPGTLVAPLMVAGPCMPSGTELLTRIGVRTV